MTKIPRVRGTGIKRELQNGRWTNLGTQSNRGQKQKDSKKERRIISEQVGQTETEIHRYIEILIFI